MCQDKDLLGVLQKEKSDLDVRHLFELSAGGPDVQGDGRCFDVSLEEAAACNTDSGKGQMLAGFQLTSHNK